MSSTERRDDLKKSLGLSDAQITEILGPEISDSFGVFSDNWPTFEVFWKIKHQWCIVDGYKSRYYQGLRYTEIDAALRMLSITDTREIFEGLQIMEQAAKEELNSKNT